MLDTPVEKRGRYEVCCGKSRRAHCNPAKQLESTGTLAPQFTWLSCSHWHGDPGQVTSHLPGASPRCHSGSMLRSPRLLLSFSRVCSCFPLTCREQRAGKFFHQLGPPQRPHRAQEPGALSALPCRSQGPEVSTPSVFPRCASGSSWLQSTGGT